MVAAKRGMKVRHYSTVQLPRDPLIGVVSNGGAQLEIIPLLSRNHCWPLPAETQRLLVFGEVDNLRRLLPGGQSGTVKFNWQSPGATRPE